MRTILLHPRAQRRSVRRGDRALTAVRGRGKHTPGAATADLAVARVREAGGPVDRASYSCGCGYLFVASVSTTVACPHCGAGQAW